MKTVYFGFSRPNHRMLGSEVIQKYMKTDFSHTYFKFKEELFEDHTIFHSVGKGLSYISETNFKSHNIVVIEFALAVPDDLYIELLQDCHNNAGVKYGFLQNIGIVLVDLLNRLGLRINKNPIDDGINCSEWIYYLLEAVFGKWVDKDPNLITPEDAYLFLKNGINIL